MNTFKAANKKKIKVQCKHAKRIPLITTIPSL